MSDTVSVARSLMNSQQHYLREKEKIDLLKYKDSQLGDQIKAFQEAAKQFDVEIFKVREIVAENQE